MQCSSCRTEIPSMFSHAFKKNECPACGDQLFDEETMGLMDDLETSILSEVRLRKESVSKLVLMLITGYDIKLRDSIKIKEKKEITEEITEEVTEEFEEEDAEEEITEKQIKKKITISQQEREKIMAEAISKHYGVKVETSIMPKKELSDDAIKLRNMVEAGLSDNELLESSLLKEQNALRIAKQKGNILSGKSKVRRSG